MRRNYNFCDYSYKKVNFSETPSKRDFKKFAEEVFEAYYSRSFGSSNECLCYNGLIQMM